MKKRDYKESGEGVITHIYNRGNNREKIFYDYNDYKAFMYRLGLSLGIEPEIIKREPLLSIPNSRIRITGNAKLFSIHAFCLMPNHFHLLIEQHGKIDISKIIAQVCTSYAMYINKKYKRVGHVFQERFKSVVIENNSHLMAVSAYIHMNPTKDKIIKRPDEYMWSSYKEYVGKRNLPIVDTDLIKSIFGKDFEKETKALYEDELPN